MVVRRIMNHSGVIKVYLIGSKRYAYRLKFKRAIVPEWVVSAMNSIGDGIIGFEEESSELLAHNEGQEIILNAPIRPNDPTDEVEPGPDDDLDNYGIDELDEAIRVLERDEEEEPVQARVETRATTDQDRFRIEEEADRYAEYVAMGWREPEAQDIGRVVFDRNFKRSDANLIRARGILREAYLSRHGAERDEPANMNQAMKSKPNEAWDALLSQVALRGSVARLL